MLTYTRNNAWNNGGTFENTDLLWYAKAVGVMQSRDLDDPTSWWFYAAIHGQYIVDDNEPGKKPPKSFPNWGDIPGLPEVPTTPLPNQGLIDKYWDQCQHGTWFFLPWHRGYLHAIENILREIIISLDGPAGWALPYWNYFGPENQYEIPPAFMQQTMNDKSPNPLFVTARYGPSGDGNVYAPITTQHINQDCQKDPTFTGTAPGNYAGGPTSYEHLGGDMGDLEGNPHGLVHNGVGGIISKKKFGLMADLGLASLDPVFYLHHCNIDRMWAAWNKAGNQNPTDKNWLNGPSANGDKQFYMPKPDKSDWLYTPGMMTDISQLSYTYDDLSLGVPPAFVSKNVQRLRNLAILTTTVKPISQMSAPAQTELVGANSGLLKLTGSGARASVKLAANAWRKVIASLNAAPDTNAPDEIYLELEGVKGELDASVYAVSVNHHYAGHFGLFGIRKASLKNGPHGGAGLTIRIDISNIIDQLYMDKVINVTSLDVLIQPATRVIEDDVCTIDRVSVYRKT